jgi:hypothetical protein
MTLASAVIASKPTARLALLKQKETDQFSSKIKTMFRQLRPALPWCQRTRLRVWFRLLVAYSLVAARTPFSSIRS